MDEPELPPEEQLALTDPDDPIAFVKWFLRKAQEETPGFFYHFDPPGMQATDPPFDVEQARFEQDALPEGPEGRVRVTVMNPPAFRAVWSVIVHFREGEWRFVRFERALSAGADVVSPLGES